MFFYNPPLILHSLEQTRIVEVHSNRNLQAEASAKQEEKKTKTKVTFTQSGEFTIKEVANDSPNDEL